MACRVVWCKNAADAWWERNDGIGEMSVHVEAQLAGKTLFSSKRKKRGTGEIPKGITQVARAYYDHGVVLAGEQWISNGNARDHNSPLQQSTCKTHANVHTRIYLIED
jgi:ATP-dependent DNA ligase